ncbi:microfibrillar-associated protein 5 [Sceloporus undulatus]|uniref:microfibrillar-associated protein 5 n=1 Tax=Sceloporus undulatus TaxID=8520 RepID=UPI001C4D3496|nr:microfibrillar-associated protein 5 [Sceloporus undulatus]
MRAGRAQMLLCLIALAVLPCGVLNQDPTDDPVDDVGAADPGETVADEKADGPTTSPECHEEQFPCTRLYSVRKPVKQCISYLCVTSIRRTYMINKEICSRIVCKEDEAMQDELCRQLAGLPPRRLRRSGHSQGPLCRRSKNQQQKALDAQ